MVLTVEVLGVLGELLAVVGVLVAVVAAAVPVVHLEALTVLIQFTEVLSPSFLRPLPVKWASSL